MFWKGRVLAIIWLATAIGIIMFCIRGEFAAAGGFFFFMFFVRLVLWMLDRVWTAVTGNPLFYDAKVLDRGDE